jgi:hypothetical protein
MINTFLQAITAPISEADEFWKDKLEYSEILNQVVSRYKSDFCLKNSKLYPDAGLVLALCYMLDFLKQHDLLSNLKD